MYEVYNYVRDAVACMLSSVILFCSLQDTYLEKHGVLSPFSVIGWECTFKVI